MPAPRIIPYTCDDSAECPGLRHLAVLTVDRVVYDGKTPSGVTADLVMNFYGTTAEAAHDAAEKWFVGEQTKAAVTRANIEAGATKRAEARKARAAA
jgi:hypothetical protein